MKMHVLASMALLFAASLASATQVHTDEKRRIRHFLYTLAEQTASFSLAPSDKQAYLELMQEHVSHVQAKLDHFHSHDSFFKAMYANKNSVKGAIAASSAAICGACMLVGYRALNTYIQELAAKRLDLTEQVTRLTAMINQTHNQPSERLVDVIRAQIERYFAGSGQSDIQDAAFAIPLVNNDEPARRSVAACMLYTVGSLIGAYSGALHALDCFCRVIHEEDHLIITIEKDKAVIAMLERM